MTLSMTSHTRAAHLLTDVQFSDPDEFYEALIDMHRDLSEAASALVNAKLILLLANHIGDLAVLREAMALARQDVPTMTGAATPEAGAAAPSSDVSSPLIQNKETDR